MKKNIQCAILSIFLFLLIFSIYGQTKNFEFISFDDVTYVTENPHVLTGLIKENIIWAFSQVEVGHWHPLSWLSHQLDIELFGLNPGAHHLENVFFHTINSVLFFIFLFLLFNDLPIAFLVAALFALHPQRIESVSWISERKDVLSAFFGILSLFVYRHYVTYKSRIAFIVTHLFLILGLLAKPSLVVFPVLFLILDLWPLARIKKDESFLSQLTPLILEKIFFILISLSFSITVFMAQDQVGAMKGLDVYSWSDRFTHAGVAFLSYIGKTIWPASLSFFYPLHPIVPGLGVAAFFFICGTSWFFWKHFRERPHLLFSWLWFGIALLPVIGLVPIGGQIMADRWAYIPHLGIGIGLTGSLSQKKIKRSLIYFILTSLVLLSSLKTFHELSFWKNNQLLYERALSVDADNFMAHNNLGMELGRLGKNQEALYHYQEAVRLNPTYPEALNNLGTAKAKNKNFKEAIPLFMKALERSPHSATYRYNLALAHYQSGSIGKAFELWVVLLKDHPDYQQTKGSLSYFAKQNTDEFCRLVQNGAFKINPETYQNILAWHSEDIQVANKINEIKACVPK